jgi:hypothetical protein
MAKDIDKKSTRPLEMRLGGKKLRFAQEYLLDFDGTAAAERAGYKGSTKGSMSAMATRLKNDPDVQEYVYDKLSKAKVPILVELNKLAYTKADGKKLKSSDKVAALDKLIRIMGLYQDAEFGQTNVQPVVNISLGSDETPKVTIDAETDKEDSE